MATKILNLEKLGSRPKIRTPDSGADGTYQVKARPGPRTPKRATRKGPTQKAALTRATNVGASLGYFYPEVMLDANKTGTMRAGGNVGKEPPRFHGQTKRTFEFPLIGIACSQVGGEREHGAGGGV